VRFICVASIVRAKRALLANDEPVKVQFQKLGDGVDECVAVCDKSPEDTRTADAIVIPFSLRNNFPSRCCWPAHRPGPLSWLHLTESHHAGGSGSPGWG
jgi:hypothetical protein